MPTINEVWEQAQQINANLATLHNDLTALSNKSDLTNVRLNNLTTLTVETNDWLEDLRQTVNSGFLAMAAAFAGVIARQDITNQLLHHQTEQQKTIICILEHISQNTCSLLNYAAEQTDVQKAIAANTKALQHMYATANPGAALDYERHVADRKRLEECCPPEPRQPDCIYEPCSVPKDIEPGRPQAYEGFADGETRVVRRRLPPDDQ
jgi:hypothetical protein